MIVHPELRALRGDDTPQRNAQTALYLALQAWREQTGMAGLVDELQAFSQGAAIADCTLLAELFAGDGTVGHNFAASFVAQGLAALQDAPLGHIPLRHFTDGFVSTLLLARSGSVTLTLVAHDGSELAQRPAPRTVTFGPNESWELILAGEADAELIGGTPSGPDAMELKRQQVRLRPGSVLVRAGHRESRTFKSIDGTLVALRLQRRRANPMPTREYNLADGAFVYQASGSPRDSRLELMLALLGRMQRRDAAPQFADLARSDASAALRWQALRECLALDTATGFAALCDVAMAASDPLAVPAGALRAQLIEAHPQLQELAPCLT